MKNNTINVNPNLKDHLIFTNYKYFIYFKYAILLYIHYSNSLIVIHLYCKLSLKLCVNLKKTVCAGCCHFILKRTSFCLFWKNVTVFTHSFLHFSYKKFLFRWLLVLIIHLIYIVYRKLSTYRSVLSIVLMLFLNRRKVWTCLWIVFD